MAFKVLCFVKLTKLNEVGKLKIRGPEVIYCEYMVLSSS